ncbi:MAG: DsbA family protein [Anaerolineales bacterium]|nr:DsbA family protein [Anaerolineales bacterium]
MPRKQKSENSLAFVILLPVVFLLGVAFGFLVWGHDRTTLPAAQAQAGNAPTEEVRIYDVSSDDDPALGPEDAPITIIEFSDYQCPFCARWHSEVFDRLMANYPGQIRFVYRDFPLTSIHPGAMPAAEAANCANEQGAFWAYHEALFSYQYEFSNAGLLQYAVDLGLDSEAFSACLESHRYQDEVQADAQYALMVGVQSTPTFFINGRIVIGAQPYEIFKQIIDEEMAGGN